MWPSVDMSKDDCRKTLRSLELDAYGRMVDVLRAQGHFSVDKKKLLSDVASALSIPTERHKAEIRRAVNDERLNSVAEVLVGPNTSTEWAIEGRRMIPLLPRPQQNTVFKIVADESADYVSTEREVASEGAFKAAEFPFAMEPASPEPSKTPGSPSGVIVFPSGTAIQMKRELDEDEADRKKRKMPTAEVNQTASPHKVMVGNQQQITMSSRTVPSPFPPGSTPLKIALPAGSARTPATTQTFNSTAKQVIIVSSSTSPNTPSILQKTLSVPIKTTANKSTVMYSQAATTPEVMKQRPKAMQSTPIGKPRPSTIVVSQKTPVKAVTTTKQGGMSMQSKFVVQQKPVSRNVQKPTQVMVQQKGGKSPVMANVQVKTAQGFANVPMQMRAGAKHVQIKADSTGGPMKMVSISGAAKILPKPSQPVYVVTTTTASLAMVPRTVPAACPSRVMSVAGPNLKWSQAPLSGKSLQTMQLVSQQRRADGVVLVQKGPSGKPIIPHTIKESPINKQSNIKTVSKAITTTMSPQLAQSLQQIQNANQTQGVILVDISNQEKNTALADFLQASGIIHDGDVKTVTIGVGSGNDSTDDSDPKQDKTEIIVKEEVATIPSLSIEEAVEMLNRSDTPETRALLSQAGIQISDEIADSEEEEQIIEKSTENQTAERKLEEVTIRSGDHGTCLDSGEEGEVTLPTTSSASLMEAAVSTAVTLSTPSLPTAVHTLASRPRPLDIFTTALTSANINLDSFMEEEDEPEPPQTVKDEEKPKENETNDSCLDPLDNHLAELRNDMSQ